MLDKYLKIFNLSKDFSKVQLENEYKRLLKKLNPKEIDDQLKSIFLEEIKNIDKYYEILLEDINKREKKVYYYEDSKYKDSLKRNIKRKRGLKKTKNKINQQNILFLTLIIIIISFLVFFLTNDLEKFNENNNEEQLSCEITFNGLIFTDNRNQKEIRKSSTLMKCFKNGYIKLENKGVKKYRISGDSKIEYSTNNHQFKEITSIKELDILLNLIKNSKNKNVKKEVQYSISKILNYQKIKSKNGLKGPMNEWKLASDYNLSIMSNKSKVFNNGFKTIRSSINKYEGLTAFLKDKLPQSIYKSILRINTKTTVLEKERIKIRTTESYIDTTVNQKLCKTINNSYDWDKKIYLLLKVSIDSVSEQIINNLIIKTNNQKITFKECMCGKCLNELKNPDLIVLSNLITTIKNKDEIDIYNSSNNNLNTFKNKLKLNRENQITEDLNNDIKKKYCTTIRGSYFWKLKLKNLKKSKSVKNKVLKRNSLINEISVKVEKFKNCYCEKCKDELSNKALKEIINVFLNNNNYENE